ncbi:hypothetical protein, partial [Hafnia paralvei]|uniref:hypothetical protein n=1 Tax=Hafnia paralvei TaxID=546367 RepID=UPI001F46C7EC
MITLIIHLMRDSVAEGRSSRRYAEAQMCFRLENSQGRLAMVGLYIANLLLNLPCSFIRLICVTNICEE